MDYKEAIRWIESHKEVGGKSMDGQAMQIAIECIEKQIPKKPHIFTSWHNGKVGECESCGTTVMQPDDFCRRCGTKIDWSDE